GIVRNKAVYLALAIRADGVRMESDALFARKDLAPAMLRRRVHAARFEASLPLKRGREWLGRSFDRFSIRADY
ncbi:MAG: hypothetical protein ACE5FO_14095, partial [Parvularculaceae bacterium]